MFHEINRSLTSLADLQDLFSTQAWLTDPEYVRSLCADIARTGLVDPFSGYIPAREVEIIGDNYRETIVGSRLNARHRAIALLVRNEFMKRAPPVRIYAPECFSGLAAQLKDLDCFAGSEYLPTEAEQISHPSVRHEDVMALSFESNSFDVYYSCDVIEHIPSIDRCLEEAARVIKPGGTLLATFPFSYRSASSIIKASLDSGNIVYHTEPEYHGNPVRPEQGSLVFTIPGWDILDQAYRAGFKNAEILAVGSRLYGITAKELASVFVLHCSL
jgi:SAM-dependent methyltransferase